MVKNKPASKYSSKPKKKPATPKRSTQKSATQTKAPSTKKRTTKGSPKKSVLGRGLKALLSDSEIKTPSAIVSKEPRRTTQGIEELQISIIETNPYQPRTHFNEQSLEELKQSITTHGLIQPITVRKLGNERYQLIAGERRLQACHRLGLQSIPAFVRKAEINEMLEMALIENIQREALNAIEIGLSYQRLISECNLKQEELATRVGKDRSTISNYLRLLKLPPALQAALRDDQISMGHARSLLSIEDTSAQLLLLQEILKKSLSVRQTEAIVRKISKQQHPKSVTSSLEASTFSAYLQVQQDLSSLLSTKVRLHHQKDEIGEIRITFFSKDDLNRIIDAIRS